MNQQVIDFAKHISADQKDIEAALAVLLAPPAERDDMIAALKDRQLRLFFALIVAKQESRPVTA